MGCDIHTHVEIKLFDKWEHYNSIYVPRNYRLFGKIVGVRSDEEDPLVTERPLPEDISVVTAHDFARWKEDAHSITWLDREEAQQISDWYDTHKGQHQHPPLWGYLFENDLWDIKEAKVQDSRVILWFDN